MPVTKYIWDDENILMEKDEFGVTQKTYTLEPQVYGNLVSEYDGTNTLHHHYDALGSTRQLTDQNGDLTDDYVFDAWGNLIAHTGTSQTAFLWIGEIGYYWDDAMGRYIVRARWLPPSNACWISADPLGVATDPLFNLYRYVFGNPINASDPTGAFCAPEVPRDYCGPDAGPSLILTLAAVRQKVNAANFVARAISAVPRPWDIDWYSNPFAARCPTFRCSECVEIFGTKQWRWEVNYVLFGCIEGVLGQFFNESVLIAQGWKHWDDKPEEFTAGLRRWMFIGYNHCAHRIPLSKLMAMPEGELLDVPWAGFEASPIGGQSSRAPGPPIADDPRYVEKCDLCREEIEPKAFGFELYYWLE